MVLDANEPLNHKTCLKTGCPEGVDSFATSSCESFLHSPFAPEASGRQSKTWVSVGQMVLKAFPMNQSLERRKMSPCPAAVFLLHMISILSTADAFIQCLCFVPDLQSDDFRDDTPVLPPESAPAFHWPASPPPPPAPPGKPFSPERPCWSARRSSWNVRSWSSWLKMWIRCSYGSIDPSPGLQAVL